MLVFASISVLLFIFAFLIYRVIVNLRPKGLKSEDFAFEQLLGYTGFAYDPDQDIFYSRFDAWQRDFGYCRLYDEAAAPAGMVIDSEPVQFEYDGKRWLIQLWKGQYYLSTGCEIGVYYTEHQDLHIPDLFDGVFYYCADDRDLPMLSYSLIKGGKELFHRSEKNWWISGFRPGEFSEPSELTMLVRITFQESAMCGCFVDAMMKLGYREQDVDTDGISVQFHFRNTHTPQPLTRSEEAAKIIQSFNKQICIKYQEITKGSRSLAERVRTIREKEPLLYEGLIRIGKTRQIYKAYYKLKEYMDVK